MGKSASGKDTIYKKLLEDKELRLKRLAPYTTRPIREGEQEGVEYHFVEEAELWQMQAAGQVVELRTYHTMHGDWHYFTACKGQLDLEHENYVVIGTLDSWRAMCEYFGRAVMEPVYIEVEDGLRLERALARERAQKEPRYQEMCRRFLADTEDFSEERLRQEGIKNRFRNTDFGCCLEEIKVLIRQRM